MQISGVIECGIYVNDVARSAEFYQRVLGLNVMVQDQRFGALNAGGNTVLLIFRKGASKDRVPFGGGYLPGHDGSGQTHFALGIPAEDYEPWRERLRANGVEIETEVTWPRGGRSMYFRDPDGHAAELVTPGCWENY